MLAALASADPVTWISILAKALAYAATLLACGSVLIWHLLGALSPEGRVALCRSAVGAAGLAAGASLLRVPIQASFLMGGTWAGAADPMILGMVIDSPLGTSLVVRLIGLALILCLAWRKPAGRWIALVGALLVAMSFGMRGHALGSSQPGLGVLITLHILAASFWIGAFAPLVRASRLERPERAGDLAEAFGRQALWAVAGLVLAGSAMLWLYGVTSPAALTTGYGQMILIKLALFAALLSLAGLNKLSLTPALRAARPGAGERLRRSIGAEAVLVALILATTAALTSLHSPPRTTTGADSALNPAVPVERFLPFGLYGTTDYVKSFQRPTQTKGMPWPI